MKSWKRNAIVATVLLFVCAGMYLNWSFNQSQAVMDLTETLDADKVMGDSTLVVSEEATSTTADTDTLEELASQGTQSASDYFAEMRLSRQESRDSAVGLLQETIAYEEGDAQTTATDSLNEIVNSALSEAQIESLIIAKGFEDCVAYMGDDTISIAVAAPAEGLQPADVALISDIVTTQTSYDMTQIRVIEVN